MKEKKGTGRDEDGNVRDCFLVWWCVSDETCGICGEGAILEGMEEDVMAEVGDVASVGEPRSSVVLIGGRLCPDPRRDRVAGPELPDDRLDLREELFCPTTAAGKDGVEREWGECEKYPSSSSPSSKLEEREDEERIDVVDFFLGEDGMSSGNATNLTIFKPQ